jgi:glucokinase
LPSEGGHCDFGPRNGLEWELWHYLQQKMGHASYESLCPGPRIRNIYLFLKEDKGYPEGLELSGRPVLGNVPTPWIVEQAMATGGVYVGGGIPKRIFPLLTR